jgi:hypothetical protein
MIIGVLRANRRKLESNLLRAYKRATPDDISTGSAWYDKAHSIVCEWSEFYGVSIATVANVVAALSPQCDWNRNLIAADEVLQGNPTLSIIGPLRANIDKAKRILADRAGDIFPYFPHGPKVNSFARNIAGDYSGAITIDRHAIEAAWNDTTLPECDLQIRWTHYAVYAECYAKVARKVGLPPAIFQAIVWHVWKREHPAASKRADIHRAKKRGNR